MTVAFHTLGCKTNAYETQAVLEQFQELGFEIGDFSGKCDVYVINTCAVTKEAARKSRQIAGRCKRNNPDAVVVLAGCYAQEAGKDLADQAMADIIVGNGEKSRIVQLVSERLSIQDDRNNTTDDAFAEQPLLLLDDQTHERRYEDQHISSQGDHVRAYVKIQDGCDRFCSYCIIPYLRGRSRSRNVKDIMAEVNTLAVAGFHEIVITGIDISSFHTGDVSFKNPGNSLARLIKLISEVDGVERIRLGSLEAGIASYELINSLREIKEFCPHFHLSLQSGCDAVLKRMNRHYDTRQFAAVVQMIRDAFPEAAITTDVITGFPGETEEEFAQTVEFVKNIGFSRLHVFPYSRREGTRADKMPDQLPGTLKEQRAKYLIDVGEGLRRQYEERLIGKPCRVLVEECIKLPGGTSEPRTRLFLSGYTREYVNILIDAEKKLGEGPDLQARAASMVNQELAVIPTNFRERLYAV